MTDTCIYLEKRRVMMHICGVLKKTNLSFYDFYKILWNPKVFEVAKSKYDIRISKFKMMDPIWQIKIRKIVGFLSSLVCIMDRTEKIRATSVYDAYMRVLKKPIYPLLFYALKYDTSYIDTVLLSQIILEHYITLELYLYLNLIFIILIFGFSKLEFPKVSIPTFFQFQSAEFWNYCRNYWIRHFQFSNFDIFKIGGSKNLLVPSFIQIWI